MESYLHIGLIGCLVAVLFFLIWPLKPKRTLLDMNDHFDSEAEDDPFPHQSHEEPHLYQVGLMQDPEVVNLPQAHSTLLSINVFAKPNTSFASYDLLQSITATGMQFGEMNIFHYYHRTPKGDRITLFNLASATKPGEFDLNRMGNFSCVGLTLFMDITQVPNPLQAFYLMVSTAEQLAEDLEGELRVNPRAAWTDAHFQHYQQRIMQLEPTLSV